MTYKIKSYASQNYSRKIEPLVGARVYAELRAEVIKAGILDRDYIYYSILTFLDVAGLMLCLLLYFFVTHLVSLLMLTVGIAFFTVRIGGLVHDAGHRGIFSKPLFNDIYGYIMGGMIAFGFYSWKIKHNAHHAHTNEEDEDPDLNIPFKFLEDEPPPAKGLGRFVHKYQVWLYYPVGSLVSITSRINAFVYYNGSYSRKVFFLMCFQGLGIFVWFVLPFIIFPLWKAALFVFVVNELTGFYLLNIFAPNHKGMPQIGKGVPFSFLEKQIITSRNIFGHWLTDYVYLGLNYQIEHHLFPACPRRKLKYVRPLALRVCKKYNLPYVEMSIFGSTRFIFRELVKASLATRQ